MKVMLLCGLPGSGKSTWAKAQKATTISSDAIRAELYGSEEAQGDGREVFSLFYKRAEDALNNAESIVLDATNTSRKARSYGIALAKKYNCEVIAVVFTANADVCLKQQLKRTRQVPEFVVRRMAEKWEEPSVEEGFNKIIKI